MKLEFELEKTTKNFDKYVLVSDTGTGKSFGTLYLSKQENPPSTKTFVEPEYT